jgi:hypothetical protein
MDEPQPVAKAAAGAGSAGFIVHRNGNDVEIQIDAPSRAGGITVACLVSALIVVPSYFLLSLLVWITTREGFDLCGATFAMALTAICLWQTIAALRRIRSAYRRGSRTIFSVRSGVFWCAAAPEPASRYVWPVVDIWHLQATPGRFSRIVLLQIQSRRRPLVRLRIPYKQPVAAETLTYILRHAIASATTPPPALASTAGIGKAIERIEGNLPAQKSEGPDQEAIQYAYSEALSDWVNVASYERFPDWRLAHSTLSSMNVPTRQEPPSAAADWRFVLSVPRSQEKFARDWLARPQEWRDHSACPRCGATGEVLPFWTGISRCIRHPTGSFALGPDWRFCSECKKSYYGRE